MRKKIFIVEDDEEFLRALESLLNIDYQTTGFLKAAEALSALKYQRPDLILLDLKMDEMNGFQFAKELEKDIDNKTVPVIVMTGYFNENEHSILNDICGFDQCLIKPFDPMELFTKVERILYC